MIQKHTFDFLQKLKQNNDRDWFKEHRPAYDAAKSNFLEFVEALIEQLELIDPKIGMAQLRAKDCITRINRDIRFSADKSPYKTNFFAFLSQGGRKSPFACYYLHLEPGNSFAGGGVYMPEAKHLNTMRETIDRFYPDWKKIVESKSFKSTFENGVQAPKTLTRPPKGFDKESPAIEYLKMKGYYGMKKLEDKALLGNDAVGIIIDILKAAQPMVHFLNQELMTAE